MGVQLGPVGPDQFAERALVAVLGQLEQGPLRPGLLTGLHVPAHPSPLRRAPSPLPPGRQSVNVGSAPCSTRARPLGSSQSSDLPNAVRSSSP